MAIDIGIYDNNPGKYYELQNLRPDYRMAIEKTVSSAVTHFQNQNQTTIADFCGGVGNVTKAIAEQISVNSAVIVDVNQKFLDIATTSGIKCKNLETICSNILNVTLDKKFDLVLSVFAYHHIPNNFKEKYLRLVQSCLKDNGIFILTEIYLDNQDLTTNYYKKLLRESSNKNPLLDTFLTETARSTQFEYKVSKKFADAQLSDLGFMEIQITKVWPLDETFADDVGAFVQIFKI